MGRRTIGRCMAIAAAGLLGWTTPKAAAAEKQSAMVGGVEIRADQLEYEAGKRRLTGRGQVMVRRGTDLLRADEIVFQTDTQEAAARGRVVLERPGSLWRGDKLSYNFKTRLGNFGTFDYFTDPYHIRARESRQVATNVLEMKDARFTTCEGDRPLVSMKMREARLIDNLWLRAKGVVVFLGPLPILYTPFLSKRLDDLGFEFIPGRSGRSGYFLLSAYTFRVSSNLLSTTHLDYRTERGWGGGQDFTWGRGGTSPRGLLTLYYADDQKPFRNAEEEEEWGELVDSDRYRLRLSDVRSLSPRDTVVTEINYLSDPRVIEEFFNDEFRQQSQPENRVTLTHQGNRYSASLALNKRLNDFYSNVNRLPEARLDIPRLQVGDTPLYYETFNSAAWLEKEYPKGQESNNYDSIRFDTGHMMYYPTRHFGFLNVTPRAGYRGTYYSTTYDTLDVTNFIVQVESNVVVVTNRVDSQVKESSGLRSLYEAGVEASFKSFGVLHNDPMGRDFKGLRHVVEPSAKYTYIPEPNLRPFELPQFDSVDELDRRNDIYFGVRNKLQTKRQTSMARPVPPEGAPATTDEDTLPLRGGQQTVQDLVDVGAYTYYRLEPEPLENEFSEIFFDARLRLVDWLPLDAWADLDPYEGEFTEARVEAALLNLEDSSRLGLQYLYRKDSRDQVAADLNLFPYDRWSFRVYARYNIDLSELEEQSYFVQHKMSCLGLGVGYKRVELDDDDQIWFQVWLTAFPQSYIKMGL